MRTRLRILSKATNSSSGLRWPEPLGAAQTSRWGHTLYRMPFPSRCTHSHPRSLILVQCRRASSPHVHIFRMWGDTGVSGESPCRHGESMQTPRGQQTWLKIDFFLINVIIKWCWKKQPYLRTCCVCNITTYILNLHNVTCQLYLNKTGKH